MNSPRSAAQLARRDERGRCRTARRLAFDLRAVEDALEAVEICVALNRSHPARRRRAWRRAGRIASDHADLARLAPTARLRRYHSAVAAATGALLRALAPGASDRDDCVRLYASIPR